MTHDQFEEAIRRVCRADTSAHPDEWTESNPFLGHCTIVSVVAQDIFGGDIMRVVLDDVPGFEHIRFHSWNRFPDETERDFTVSQLEKPIPESVVPTVRDRTELFSYPGIQRRYELLKSRFEESVGKI